MPSSVDCFYSLRALPARSLMIAAETAAELPLRCRVVAARHMKTGQHCLPPPKLIVDGCCPFPSSSLVSSSSDEQSLPQSPRRRPNR
jgi:hypothetical protein